MNESKKFIQHFFAKSNKFLEEFFYVSKVQTTCALAVFTYLKNILYICSVIILSNFLRQTSTSLHTLFEMLLPHIK